MLRELITQKVGGSNPLPDDALLRTMGISGLSPVRTELLQLTVVPALTVERCCGIFLSRQLSQCAPAAIFSGVMFLICLGLYLFVDRVDSEVRGSENSGCW